MKRILATILISMVFFLGFCAGKAAGAPEEPAEPLVEAVVKALLVAAEGNENPQPVADLSGIEHLAGVDPDAVLTLDKHQGPVPELRSLGTYKITAYCACQICCGKSLDDLRYGITATGTIATQGRTIAADPAVLPYGTVVVINGHEYIVEDCGGAIDGKEIDMYFDSHQEAREWGNQYWEVFTNETVH